MSEITILRRFQTWLILRRLNIRLRWLCFINVNQFLIWFIILTLSDGLEDFIIDFFHCLWLWSPCHEGHIFNKILISIMTMMVDMPIHSIWTNVTNVGSMYIIVTIIFMRMNMCMMSGFCNFDCLLIIWRKRTPLSICTL